jgi:putative oxidoreductase
MSRFQALALLALRVALGLLMLVWGADKLVNPAHGAGVAEHFYFGLFGTRALMPVLGVLQLALGACVVLGAARRAVYPALLAVTGLTLVGVWRSVVDPWGWYLDGTNALFFPSLIVFAGALVVSAFRAADALSVDQWLADRARSGAHPRAASAIPSEPRPSAARVR